MTAPVANTRQPDHPIERINIERWSPRSFSGEEIPVETLMTIFEAARWAPSSYNSQPWRFIWGRRGTPAFDTIFKLLVPGNQSWCADAAALVIACSSETMNVPGKPEPVPSASHSFDTGAAWMAMSLEAQRLGWHTHGMIGFNMGEAATELKVPLGFKVEVAIAIGKRGDPGKLPEQLRSREMPSPRKPLGETVFEGAFPG